MRRVLLFLMSLLFCSGVNAAVTIVKDGQPQAIIVTAEKPSASATRAAAELQKFVELMSGAKLPIQTDATPPAGPVLLVGRSKLTTGVDIPSGTDRDFTREGFVLKTRGEQVVLAGNEDGDFNGKYHGTEYSVYELLERLGCRWYFPGDYGQVVPKLKTITVPNLDVAQRPSFVVRNVWTSLVADITGDLDDFLLRNKGTTRADTIFAFPGDGTIQNLVPLAKYAKQYPEIYAMNRDGKRQDESTPPHMTMVCMSSPKAVELAALSIGDFFRDHPDANSYGFSAPDSAAICYCPLCTARMHDIPQDRGNVISASDGQSNFLFRSISDPYFNFVNNLAWEVNKSFPDKYLVTLAYATRVLPPEGLEQPWNKNVIIQLAQYPASPNRALGTPTSVFAMRQMRTLAGWSRMTPKMLVYDYDPDADFSRMPFWRSRAIARDMRTYHQHHVAGFTTEGNNTFFKTGLNYYIRTRLMWDVNADPEALLADFYKNFFGPAAVPMQQFGESIETMLDSSPDNFAYQPFNWDWSATYPREKIAALAPLLDRAEQLVNTPEQKQRVHLYRVLHNYMTQYSRVYALQHEGKYSEALAVFETLPKLIDEAQAIQPGLMPPDVKWIADEGLGYVHLKNRLAKLADRASGEKGELLGRAPAQAQFLPDPKNVGLFEQWQREDVGSKLKWNPIDLRRDWGLNGYRDNEGYAYDGIGWYRMALRVKKPTQGRAQLTVPLVFAEKIWIWVNGQLVASPTNMEADRKTGPTPGQAVRINDRGYVWLDIDIHDQLRANADNTITFRLMGTLERAQHRGIAEIPFVWVPKK
jgi:hypothetical protein